MNVLVTGAHGLLGRCVVRSLAGHDVVAVAHRPGDTPAQVVELTDASAVATLLATVRPTHIINCAALRSPEYCLAHPAEAYTVNGMAVEFLARAADRIGALLCQVSTDYVFPGDKPPYLETDAPRPVNVYGRSKLAGEYAARSAARHLIVRIPALYRLDAADPRNVVTETLRWLRAGEVRPQDDRIVRHYTLADEIADALRFMLERGVEGVVHVSAEEAATRAVFTRKLAAAAGCSMDQVPLSISPPTEDLRPFDSLLNPARYLSLGGRPFTNVSEALTRLRF